MLCEKTAPVQIKLFGLNTQKLEILSGQTTGNP